jgi:hypothetical protein
MASDGIELEFAERGKGLFRDCREEAGSSIWSLELGWVKASN